MHASLGDIALDPAGQATIALEAIAMATMLPFLYIEVASAIEYGRSWFTIQNVIDACTYINQARSPPDSSSGHCVPSKMQQETLSCPLRGKAETLLHSLAK